MEFGGFDDDLFESSEPRRLHEKKEEFDEAIRAYKPRQVTPLKFLTEEMNEIEDVANLNKMKADYYYSNRDYAKSLQLYQTSLELSRKSNSLNNTIFQKELAESIAKCLCYLNRRQEALDIISKLEETAVNFELYSSTQFSRLNIIEHDLNNNETKLNESDELFNLLCRILILHPCYSVIWIKLCDCLWSKIVNQAMDNDQYVNLFSACYSITKQVIKHAALARDKDVGAKRTSLEASWMERKETELSGVKLNTELMKRIDSTSGIFERLETADKMDEADKIGQARRLVEPSCFLETWLASKY